MRVVLSGTALLKNISSKSLRGHPATNAMVSQFGSVSLRIVIPIAPVDSGAFGAPDPAATDHRIAPKPVPALGFLRRPAVGLGGGATHQHGSLGVA